jgi:hypothetical protein
MIQDAPAHAQHHRPMSANQGRKGCAVTADEEVFHKLPVGPLGRTAAGRQPVDVPQNKGELGRGHGRDS